MEKNLVRAALENYIEDMEMQLRGGIADPAISGGLATLCEVHGYGNVMATVSTLWRAKHPGSAFLFGPCVGTGQKGLELANLALATLPPK